MPSVVVSGTLGDGGGNTFVTGVGVGAGAVVADAFGDGDGNARCEPEGAGVGAAASASGSTTHAVTITKIEENRRVIKARMKTPYVVASSSSRRP